VFLAGLGVLGMLGWKVFGRVRSLGRTVGTASTRIADASAELETIAPRER
jgi:hypothetical protein